MDSTVKHLPPDPDCMNDPRSDWADAAIEAFQLITGTNRYNALKDLLVDLRHWADRNGEDFDAVNKNAAWHYGEETRAEFKHTPENCPSKHHNPGDDICADCGQHLD